MRSRQSLIIFLSEYAKSAIGFVTIFFITRLIGASAIGVVGYHLGLLGLFAICLDLGISTAHIKRVSEKKDLGECVGTYLALKLITIVIYSVIIFVYIYIVPHPSFGFKGIQDHSIFVILFFYYIFDHMTGVLTNTFTGRQEFVKLNAPTLIGRCFKMCLGIFLAYLGWSAEGLAIAYLADAVTSFSCALFLFKKANIPIKKPTVAMLKSYLAYAAPMMIIIPTSIFSTNIIQVMIGQLSNSEQVGFYFAIQSLIAIPNAISSSAMTVLLPKVSADHAKRNHKEMSESVHKATRYLSIIITPIAVIFCALSDPILRMCYGFNSLQATHAFVFLSLSIVMVSIGRPYANFLLGIGKHYNNVLVNLGSLIILVLGCAFFIPARIFTFKGLGLGAGGAGLAHLSSWIFAGCFYSYLACKEFNLSFNWQIMKHWFSGLMMFLFMTTCRHYLPQSGVLFIIFEMIILSAFGLLIYWQSLKMSGEWQPKDWKYLQSFINPQAIKKDIIEELK